MLHGLLVWQKKTPPEFESYEVPTRDLFYIVKSFIVKNEDKKKLLDWLNSKGWGNLKNINKIDCYILEEREHPLLKRILNIYKEYGFKDVELLKKEQNGHYGSLFESVL